MHSIFANWERGDRSSAWSADPNIEYVMVDEPGSQSRTGVAALAHAWRAFLSAWDGYRLEAEDHRELEDERVLVLVRAFGRGKASGVELGETARGERGANLFHIRDGKVIRLVGPELT